MDTSRQWIGFDTIKLIIALILLALLIVLQLQGAPQSAAAPTASQATLTQPAAATQANPPTTAPTPSQTASPLPSATPTQAPTATILPTLAPTATAQPTLAPTATPQQPPTPTAKPQPTQAPTVAAPPQAAAPQPAVAAVALNPGRMVRLQFTNLPPNTQFAVKMGPGGSGAVGAPTVVNVSAPAGGTVVVWVEILSELAGSPRIDVRLENSAGFSTTTSFDNSAAFTSAGSNPGAGAQVLAPTLRVIHVQKGGVVVVAIHNLPPNTNFTAIVGKSGSQGIGGYEVGHLLTGESAGWSTTATFEIPVLLHDEAALDLRLESLGAVYVLNFKNIDY